MEPTPSPGKHRVTFRGGALNGAVLDLPARYADPDPAALVVTAGGKVYDRRRGVGVTGAEVVKLPDTHPGIRH